MRVALKCNALSFCFLLYFKAAIRGITVFEFAAREKHYKRNAILTNVKCISVAGVQYLSVFVDLSKGPAVDVIACPVAIRVFGVLFSLFSSF